MNIFDHPAFPWIFGCSLFVLILLLIFKSKKQDYSQELCTLLNTNPESIAIACVHFAANHDAVCSGITFIASDNETGLPKFFSVSIDGQKYCFIKYEKWMIS